MNNQEILKIAAKIAMINSIYNMTMSNEAVMYQANLLGDLDFIPVMDAFDKYSLTNKTNRPPTAAHIREIISPFVDERAIATELSRKIDRAVSKHGGYWEQGYFLDGNKYWEDDKGNSFDSFKKAVVSELGEIGWHAICARGGWLNVRNSANEMDEGVFIAQMREQIQSTIQLKKAGVDIANIGLPGQGNENYSIPDSLTNILDFKKP